LDKLCSVLVKDLSVNSESFYGKRVEEYTNCIVREEKIIIALAKSAQKEACNAKTAIDRNVGHKGRGYDGLVSKKDNVTHMFFENEKDEVIIETL